MTEPTPARHELPGPFTVVIPVLDEEPTIASVIEEVRKAGPEQIIVVDSGSRDGSIPRAAEAGATVVEAQALGPGGAALGKGDALWRALPLVGTPFVVFLDGDVFIDGPSFISALLGPLVEPEIVFSKADFLRTRLHEAAPEPGRITELVARPLLAHLFPDLAALAQPLSGQVAASTELMMSLDFEVDYGLEAGMLIDVYRRHGLAAIAHPDCGSLSHISQSDTALSVMAGQVMRAVLGRSGALPAGGGARPAHAG